MDIQFYGANCIRLSNKKASLIFDDNLADIGLSSVTRAGEIALFTGIHSQPKPEVKLVIDYPGEYEVSNVSIRGVMARAHIEEDDKKSAVIYRMIMDDLKVVVLGHIYPELSDEQLEAIGMVDVLFIPVGGSGYTLDPIGALKLIKKIEPKLVIPTHYDDSKIQYPVPQQSLEEALKVLAMEPKETVDKLKLKPSDLSETTQVIVLKRS
ncbi:MAG: MBL fold metallo-hydrolase [Candidatus Saccharimonadales bacterium]